MGTKNFHPHREWICCDSVDYKQSATLHLFGPKKMLHPLWKNICPNFFLVQGLVGPGPEAENRVLSSDLSHLTRYWFEN